MFRPLGVFLPCLHRRSVIALGFGTWIAENHYNATRKKGTLEGRRDQKFVFTTGVASLFDVTRPAVVNWIGKSHISGYKIGGTMRIPQPEAIGVFRKFDQSIPEWLED